MTPIAGKWTGVGIGVLGFIFIMIGFEYEYGSGLTVSWLGIVGILACLCGLIFSIVFWMCPSCGSFLPSKAWFAEYCHRCGESLDKPRFK